MKFRKITFSVISFSLFFFMSCGGGTPKKTVENTYENDQIYTDEFALEDSTGDSFKGSPYPMAVDDSFDDFVFAFAANREFQHQRTQLPLPIYEGNDSSFITEEQWVQDSLFVDRYFYTLLFDKEDDMELISHPDLQEAKVEWLYLDTNHTKSYNFKRENNIWMLKSISKAILENYKNEEFVNFYNKFASDTVFQISRLVMPLEYTTVDPEDDFQILETEIDSNSWTSLKPVLPTSRLVNINYGQSNDPESKTKILAVKGISNGFSNVFFFRINSNGKWELYKFEDIGV